MELSSASVQKDHRSLFDAALKHYGSWENAINESGLDYEEIREDRELMKYYGLKFELLLGTILKEIYGKVTKGYDQYIRPDFVVGDNWFDAKLSSWTSTINDTIEKYEIYCDSIVIIFLRGSKKFEKKVNEKSSIISIYKYIKILPVDRQQYYIAQLDELHKKVIDQEKIIKREKNKKFVI